MDPANRRENSFLVLARAERNDPSLACLHVHSTPNVVGGGFPVRDGVGHFWFNNDRDELARMGAAIGNHTHMRDMVLDFRSREWGRELMDAIFHSAAFFEGLEYNTSIKTLAMVRAGREILNKVVEHRSNFEKICLASMSLDNGGASAFASAFARCQNIERISMVRCNANDDHFAEFILGIRGLHQLISLRFYRNTNFRRAACEALATLLQDPNCNLTHTMLGGNIGVDDRCAEILASSLKSNTKITELNLRGCPITARGWRAFLKVLCNTTTVCDTFNSNHTLRCIVRNSIEDDLSGILSSLLVLNSGIDKNQVAIQKILCCHPHLDMEPFQEWDLKVLPLAISWFDRAKGYVENDRLEDVDAMKLSAIYQFVRALPLMFLPSSKKVGSKRKLEEANGLQCRDKILVLGR